MSVTPIDPPSAAHADGRGPVPAGFTHRSPVPGAAGFAAGGPLDLLAPGQVLAGFVGQAVDDGLDRLGDDELVGLLCAARRLCSWQAAVELAAVSELDRRRLAASERPGSSRASEHVAEELAAALMLTGRSADGLLGLARQLARLPSVSWRLAAGVIDLARAGVFADELAALDDVAAAAVAAAFTGRAGHMTTGQLRAGLRRMVLSVDADAARRRQAAGRAEARVETWQEASGNGALAGRELPGAEMIAADKRIDAIARALKQAGAEGSLDQLRAAVFTALLTGRDPDSLRPASAPDCRAAAEASAATRRAQGPCGGQGHCGDPGTCQATRSTADHPGTAHRAATGHHAADQPATGLASLGGSVNLVIPLPVWLGLSDTPGEAAGYGPLDAGTCRDLASKLAEGGRARWCATIVDAGGMAVGHACARAGPGAGPPSPQWLGRLRIAWLETGACSHARMSAGYRPGAVLRHLIETRNRTCVFPACRRPAAGCDLDHTVPWAEGGRTCECGLAPLCRRHHRAKGAEGWRLSQPAPGVMQWQLPHGRSYQVTPPAYPA